MTNTEKHFWHYSLAREQFVCTQCARVISLSRFTEYQAQQENLSRTDPYSMLDEIARLADGGAE